MLILELNYWLNFWSNESECLKTSIAYLYRLGRRFGKILPLGLFFKVFCEILNRLFNYSEPTLAKFVQFGTYSVK